jgi:hypothetical protein
MQTVSGLNVTELKLDVTELKLDRLIDDMRFFRLQMIGCNRRLQEIETYLKPSELDEGRELDEGWPASKWRKTMRYLTTIMLALMFMTVGAQANLITNGNFSGGNTSVCSGGEAAAVCPGWNVTLGNGPDLDFNSPTEFKGIVIPANTGFVTYGGVLTTDDVISQMIQTIKGQVYQVSFQLGINNPGAEIGGGPPGQDFNVTLGGVNIFHEDNDTTGATPCAGFATGCIQLTTHTIDVLATAANEVIAFGGLNYSATSVLVDPSVVPLDPVGVPAPIAGAGLPGLIAACGGLLGWWRNRRKPAKSSSVALAAA